MIKRLFKLLLACILSVQASALCGCSTSIAARNNDDSMTLYVGCVGTSFPTSFMPWLSRDGIAPTVASMLYNTLFTYDAENGEFEPLIARRWCYVDLEGEPLTDDGTYDGAIDYKRVEQYYSGRPEEYMAVRVELFDNVLWSDGERLTVDDVYYSFDIATDNALSNHAGALAWTADLFHESKNGELVRQGMFTAKHPDLSGTYPIREGEEDTVMYLHVNKVFGAVTTLFNTILILPEHIWKPLVSETQQLNNKNPTGDFLYQYEHPVGSGAWTLNTEETNTQTIVLDRNPSYHLKAEDGSALYKAEKIRLMLYLDQNTAIFALKKGYIDILDSAISANYAGLMEKEEDMLISRSQGAGVSCLVLNVNPSPPYDTGMKTLFADIDFRHAVALAVDGEELVDKILGGAGSTAPAGLIMPTNELLYEPDSDILSSDINERLEEANAILDRLCPDKDKEGYRLKDGERISFELLTSAGAQDTVSYLQRQLQKIGIEITFKASGSSPETTYLYQSDFDMTIQSVILSMANADIMYRAHFVTTERSSNYGKLADIRISQLIEKMRLTLDRNEKIRLIKELQVMTAQEYYKIPLYCADVISAARTDRFTGYVCPQGGTAFNNETLKNLKRAD